jgi:hypothetical protein
MNQIEITKMLPIQTKVLQTWVEGLTNMGCAFEIIAPDGTTYGGLKKTRKVDPLKPKIVYKDYVKPFLLDLNIGEYKELPFGDFEAIGLQANINARAIAIWGTGSLTTSIDRLKKVVQVVRIK